MNDADRRHSSGASDYDAIFADIVAHLNDDTSAAEQTAEPATGNHQHDRDPEHERATEHEHDLEPDSDPGTDPGNEPDDASRPGPEEHVDSVAGQVKQEDVGNDPKKSQASESIDLSPVELPLGERDPWSAFQPPLPPRQADRSDPPPAPPPAPDDYESGPVPQVWRAHEVEDYEDHFEPPAANPLPAGDLQFWAIIAGMAGGPLLLLYLVLFNRDASSYWILTAIAMCVGGFALLVSRMPGNHEDDDDGARL
jgi:hypothetical protein